MNRSVVSVSVSVCVLAAACGGSKGSSTAPSAVPATLTAPKIDAPTVNQQTDSLRPTLTVVNATSDKPGTRTYEFQISDSNAFTNATTSYITGYAATIGKTGVAEDPSGKTSWTPDQDLQPTTAFYWRARAVQGTSTGPWSETGKFKSRLVGFNRPGELYDPLIHGETVGDIVGSTTFIPGRGIQLNDGRSYVRYLLPQTITSGEFSMDVEGLRANGPGDKAKVFGMQEGQGDFITNRYRVDVQYRGVNGVPPNAITFRALYGSATDLSVRYEPDTATRFASVYPLDPSTTYHWVATWGSEFRVLVQSGGLGGGTLYNVGLPSPRGVYAPNPHYAYLGAPVGRSGSEAATIPGTIYRNVWIGNHPRPDSLGSALQ
ncbi:MAG TPA: hypothetical protein VN085_04555 [Vicinamibacterales bacterium]|nr:hypothetical protein [Vicinamibacterales bacterium]